MTNQLIYLSDLWSILWAIKAIDHRSLLLCCLIGSFIALADQVAPSVIDKTNWLYSDLWTIKERGRGVKIFLSTLKISIFWNILYK